MSTFSGLGTALSSLVAQRQALDVSAQNVANANTVGYTRQRATLVSTPGQTLPAMFATGAGIGNGVRTATVERLGDVFLDAKVRAASSSASFLTARADALSTLEKSLGEPSDTGLAAQLAEFWGGWADVANGSDRDAARAVLLERGTAVATALHTRYSDVQTQWQQARSTAVALVDRVNAAASSIADLNEKILAIENSGGTAHELSDQRDLLVTELSGLVGATMRTRENGQVDVLVGGNALVSGTHVSELALAGPVAFSQATAGEAVSVVWADGPAHRAELGGGRVAGLVSVLAPPADGGLLTGTAARFDELATQLATAVNDLHRDGVARDGSGGRDFFTLTAGQPPALGLRVALTDPAHIAAARPQQGALDGSLAAAISAIGGTSDGPDATWRAVVTDLGVQAAGARSRATVSEQALQSVSLQQLANAGVDLDEESVSMLAHQRAYEGAARVLTAIDEMLDTLINRTGIVGR